jgi:hypothetical protein
MEAEVDWGEALVEFPDGPMRVHLFVMRASFSGAAFCQASLVETQQAFLELHVQAFEWFGGVFCEIRFDNLKSAVKKVLKGRRRVESDRFVALRSHYLFESQFTTPGIEGAQEKGGVEGEVSQASRRGGQRDRRHARARGCTPDGRAAAVVGRMRWSVVACVPGGAVDVWSTFGRRGYDRPLRRATSRSTPWCASRTQRPLGPALLDRLLGRGNWYESTLTV